MNLLTIKIDIKDNEKEVVDFLHSYNIFERGQITCPEKEIWLNFCHYIHFSRHHSCINSKTDKNNWYYYTYENKDKKYQSNVLEIITFEQLKDEINKLCSI